MNQKIQRTVLNDQNISREELGKALQADLKMCLVLINEMTHDKDIFDAVLDIYWKRYKALQSQTSIKPE